jgi:hypothetical protein
MVRTGRYTFPVILLHIFPQKKLNKGLVDYSFKQHKMLAFSSLPAKRKEGVS